MILALRNTYQLRSVYVETQLRSVYVETQLRSVYVESHLRSVYVETQLWSVHVETQLRSVYEVSKRTRAKWFVVAITRFWRFSGVICYCGHPNARYANFSDDVTILGHLFFFLRFP